MNEETGLPNVTVVTLNYNGKHYLEKHYQSLVLQSYANFKLVFVDNGSNDGSEEFVRNNFPKVDIIKIPENVGPVKGYNAGAFSVDSESKYTVIVGNDTWFDKDWLKEMIIVAEQDDKIAICGACQMNYDGSVLIHYGGVGLDMFGYPASPKNKMKDYFYADGVSLLVRTEVFKQLNGFDDRYFVFSEESDLAWRARLLGYKIVIAPKAIMYHALGGTLGKNNLDKKRNNEKVPYMMHLNKRFYAEKNVLCSVLKNYSLITLIFVLPIILFLNIGEIIFFLIAFKPSVSWIYPRSWWWNLKNIKETIKRRRIIQKNRIISDREIMKFMYKGYGKLRSLRSVGFPSIQ